MATQFRFQGRQMTTAKSVSGTIPAPDVDTAKELLLRRGVILEVPLTPASRLTTMLKSDIGSELKKPKLNEWTTVVRSLATTEQSGVPFTQSIELIRDGLPDDSRSRAILTVIGRDIADGTDIADAFRAQQHLVGEQTVALIEAGSQSGALGSTLERLAEMTERQLKQRRQIIGALSYPLAIFAITMLMAVGILMTVVPTFEEVFTEFGIDLPWPTKLMIWMGNTLRSLAVILPATPFAMYFAWKQIVSDPERRHAIDRFKLSLPLIGKVLHLSAVGRVADVMATMNHAGMPSERSLRYAAAAAGNAAVARSVETAREMERDGTKLSEAFASQEPVIPNVFFTLISQGEVSGRTGDLMENYAEKVDDEVAVRVTALTEILQPLMMLMVMGTVSIIGVAIYLPILNIYDAVAA